MDREHELEEQVRQLRRLVEEMGHRIVLLESNGPATHNESEARSSRRGFLRMGAAAAAGAVGMAAARVLPVAAADGAAVTTGSATTGETATTITGDGTAGVSGAVGAPVPVFAAHSNGFDSTALSTFLGAQGDSLNAPLQGLGASGITNAAGIEGVDGWAPGQFGIGVYGLTDAGVGVTGEASSGIGLYARGTGRLLIDPQNLAGDPTTNFPNGANSFEQIRDLNGVVYVSGPGSGSGGGATNSIWRRLNTPRVDAATGSNNAFKPLRLIDTRLATGASVNGVPQPTGGSAAMNTTKTYTVAGATNQNGTTPDSNIPSDAIAVFGNLTVVAGSTPGFLAIHPAGTSYDPTKDPATFNFAAGAIVSNGFFCGLGTGGSAGMIAVFIGNTAAKVNIIIDITGYVQ